MAKRVTATDMPSVMIIDNAVILGQLIKAKSTQLGMKLADFAEACEIDKKLLSRQLIGLADKVLSQLEGHELLEQLKQQPYIGPEDIRYCELLRNHIVKRTEHLKAQAADIPGIRL